jgi:membrane-associated protease RseP (regulator of RpoE activity)
MTSAADFHILSARNVFGLVAVVVAVLIPVGLKRVFKQDLGELNEAEAVLAEQSLEDTDIIVPVIHSFGDSAEEVTGRRHLAQDSGMDLAGPSAGDGSLDVPPIAGVKGKSKVVGIFPKVTDGGEAASGGLAGVSSRRGDGKEPVKGYGATDAYRPTNPSGVRGA